MISVLLADDHIILRNSIRFLLEAQGDIQIVSMASDGREAVEQAISHCPDLAVIDISMPVMDGIEATKHICAICPHTRIVILTTYDSAAYVQRAIAAGASGYVSKDSMGQELIPAVRALSEGGHYFSKDIKHISEGFRWEPGKNMLDRGGDSEA